MRSSTKAALFLSAAVAVAAACGSGNREGARVAAPSNGGGPASPPPGRVVVVPPHGEGDVSRAPGAPSTAYVPKDLPIGVSPVLYAISVPKERVPTPPLVKLGDRLFNDPRLSVDGTVSCATCHDPKRGFVDHERTSEGVNKQHGQRNAPTILNAMFNATQFWDGRAATLEDQAKLPILNPVEMAQKSPEDAVAKVRGIPEYASAFQEIFGRAPTFDDVAAAIAAFERTKYAGDAPFDRFIAGDETAMDASAKRGWALFNGRGRCNSCHAGNATAPLFSDQKFHNIGIAAHKQDFAALAKEALAIVREGDREKIDRLAIETKYSELGRFLVTAQRADVGAFKTPTLRNVAVTAPYMHDGSLATLWDVMDHYNKGGVPNPYLDGGMQRLGLGERDIDDVVAFLVALTSDDEAAFAKTEMAKQRARKNVRPERDTAAATGKKGDLGDVAPAPDLAKKSPATNGVFGAWHTTADGGAHGHQER